MSRILWILALVTVLMPVGCGRPPSRDALAARGANVDELLANARTREQLTYLTGVPPTRCVEIPGDTRLCQWELGNRDPGWRALATAAGTDDRVNLMCALPRDGSPRGPDSCVVVPRRSDRHQYALPSRSGASRATQRQIDAMRVRNKRVSEQRVDAARTAFELSRMVGVAPERCEAVGPETIGCTWRAGNAAYGHGTLAEYAGAPKRKRMRMRCQLPADGRPRDVGSCHVEIDA